MGEGRPRIRRRRRLKRNWASRPPKTLLLTRLSWNWKKTNERKDLQFLSKSSSKRKGGKRGLTKIRSNSAFVQLCYIQNAHIIKHEKQRLGARDPNWLIAIQPEQALDIAKLDCKAKTFYKTFLKFIYECLGAKIPFWILLKSRRSCIKFKR